MPGTRQPRIAGAKRTATTPKTTTSTAVPSSQAHAWAWLLGTAVLVVVFGVVAVRFAPAILG